VRRHIQSLTRLILAFILIFASLGLEGKIQPVAAATWTSFNPGFGVGSFGNEVAYGNGTWLLYSQSGEFGKSTDSSGAVFHKSASVFPCKVLELEHVGTQWLAACDNGKIYTLADGQDPLIVSNWLPRDTGKSVGLVGIATDGNMIVVVGDSGGTVLFSDNGHDWVDRSIVGVSEFKAVTYGEGKFIAVGKASDNSDVIYSSEDGETWNKVTTAAPSKQLYGIDYGAGMFVACGVTGYLYVSEDGVTWEPKTAPDDTGAATFITIAYGAGQFYIGGTSETILISSNGSDFSKEIKGGSAKSVTSIAVGNGKAIAVGTSGLLLTASAIPPVSSNASLANFQISPGSLIFNASTTSYSVEVPNTTASIDVDWSLDDPSKQTLQSVKVDGTAQSLGPISGLALTPGTARMIEIVVKAEDGSTNTYTLTVTRKRLISSGSGGSYGGSPSKNESTLPEGITQSIGNDIAVSIDIFDSDGKTPIQSGVTVDAKGRFQFNSLKPGSYSLVLYLLADDGTKLAGQIAQLTVDESNAAKVTIADIAPYGTATDALTKKPLQGVEVSVYWADTNLNRNMGRKSNTRVELPRVQGMASQNANLQSTASDGQFGWLLPPDGDYYVIAEKEGYETYDGHGSILHVGKTAVKLNFALQAKVLEKGVLKAFVSGYPNGTFRPNADVTRAELASMLLKALGIQPRASAVEYSDVPVTNWAAGAIAQLTEQGLMVGYPDGTFGPDRPITRAEFTVVLVRANQLTRGNGESSLHDIDGHWAKGAILLAEQAGLIHGNLDGTFNPDSKLTRAQAVVILTRMLGLTSQEKFEHRELSDVPADFWAYDDIMRAIADHEYQKLGNGLTLWK